jgi:hypothetical protein
VKGRESKLKVKEFGKYEGGKRARMPSMEVDIAASRMKNTPNKGN